MIRYKSYKDSGISWLGHIPDSWHKVRNKYIFQEISDCRSTGEETLLTVSHITGVTPRSEKNVNMFFAESMAGYKRVNEGDLIINTMWAWMGALGVAKERGICSPAYNVYRNNKGIGYCAKYFDYLFRTPNFIIEMTRFSKGIVDSRLRLYPKDFFRIQTCLPSIAEQTAIAHYLDTKTEAIDKKVSQLEKKIGCYQELRKSLINETVTKGLDKNVKLKESGIDGIGQIPEHWEVKRLKDVAHVNQRNLPENTPPDYSFTYIDIANFDSSGEDIQMIEFRDAPSRARRIVKKGDVIISTVRTYLKAIAVFDFDVSNTIVSTGFAVLTARKFIYPKFLGFLVRAESLVNKVAQLSSGVSYPAINASTLISIEVVIPPQEEQIQIADFLEEKTTTITKIIANIQTQITTLKELHKTLINDVVTGKIKVTP